MRIAFAPALVLFLLCSVPSRAREVRSYPVQHRAASELVPALETLLTGAPVAVVAVEAQNTLLLAGEPAAIAAALEALALLDVEARTVVIRHEARRESDLRRRGLDVRWTASEGPVRIGNVPGPRSRASVEVGALAERSRVRRDEGTSSSIRTLEGSWATIRTGTDVPFEVRGPYGRETVWASAASGVEVRPTILGDGRIRLEVSPFEGSVESGGRIRSSGADTVVIVEPGESVAIGGFTRSGSSRGAGTRGRRSETGDDELVLLVSAELAR